MGFVASTRFCRESDLLRIRAFLGLFCPDFYSDIRDFTQILCRYLPKKLAAGTSDCDFFRKFITKITVSNAKKIAMKFFGSEMTPTPLLSEIFRKFIRFRGDRLPLASIPHYTWPIKNENTLRLEIDKYQEPKQGQRHPQLSR